MEPTDTILARDILLRTAFAVGIWHDGKEDQALDDTCVTAANILPVLAAFLTNTGQEGHYKELAILFREAANDYAAQCNIRGLGDQIRNYP